MAWDNETTKRYNRTTSDLYLYPEQTLQLKNESNEHYKTNISLTSATNDLQMTEQCSLTLYTDYNVL